MPFEIPNSWAWTRLGFLVLVISGVSYDKKDVCASGIRILRGGNINNLQITLFDDDIFLPYSYKSIENQVQLGDVVIVASTGSKAVIGKAGYVKNNLENTQIGAFLRIVRPVLQDFASYIQTIFATDYYKEYIQTQSKGTNINNIKVEYITNLLVPIPPLAEQERIVAEIEKYEPLIAEYDKLEQEKSKLDGEIYDKLKKSILQYAIQGKLVLQEPTDEPASVLLEKIRAEKKAKLGKKYVDSFIYKGDDNCYYEHIDGVAEDKSVEVPFDLPDGWAWCKIKEFGDVLGGKRIPAGRKLSDDNNGHIYIKVSDMKNGSVNTDKLQYVPDDIFMSISRYIIKKEDIYITVAGTIGQVGIIPAELDGANLTENADRIVFRRLNQKWLLKCLESNMVQTQIIATTTKVGQPKLAIARIQEFLIPLPPLAEQQRIVYKINEIFANL